MTDQLRFSNMTAGDALAIVVSELQTNKAQRAELAAEARDLKKVFCGQFGFKAEDMRRILDVAGIDDPEERDQAVFDFYGTTSGLLECLGYTPEKLAAMREARDDEAPEA